METNLDFLFWSLLPALIYAFVIYINVPQGTIRIRTAITYLLIGVVSISFLKYFWLLFPTMFGNEVTFEFLGGEADYWLVHAFFQVALFEEISKYGAFWVTSRARDNRVKLDHPFATMFYSGMAAFGFAVFENLTYAAMYGKEVLLTRAFTAIVLHFMAGLIIGYWVALGRLQGFSTGDRSWFQKITNKYRWLRKTIYASIGIFLATFFHGLYDFNLMYFNPASGTLMLLIMGVMMMVLWSSSKDLVNKSTKRELQGFAVSCKKTKDENK